FAEWVVWRLSAHTDVTVPLNVIDAAWAIIADWRYFDMGENRFKHLAWDDWLGPTRRPLCVASRMLINAVHDARRNMDVAGDAVYVANLAEYVLPKLKTQFR